MTLLMLSARLLVRVVRAFKPSLTRLSGENMDVVQWEEDPADYIANALNPAQVIAVQFNDEANDRSATVIVPDYQLSLAIGKGAKCATCCQADRL